MKKEKVPKEKVKTEKVKKVKPTKEELGRQEAKKSHRGRREKVCFLPVRRLLLTEWRLRRHTSARLQIGGLSLSHQYSRIAMSKYQVRRISITSNSRAKPGGNAW